LRGSLDVGALEKALHALTQRHEALRTAFAVVADHPMQAIAPELEPRFERVGLGTISAEDFPSEVRRRAGAAARARIDLTQPPLWSFTLLERTDTERVLLVNTHHIVSDRWSVGILMQELAAEYTALVRGEPSPLPASSSSYSDVIGQI